jgi:DNA-binding NtrC family response regulator
VTCANTLDKGLNVLESAQGNSDVNAHFDVALVEEEQVAPIMRDVMNGTNSSPLFGRFTTIAKEVAIVLMHEDEDVASKTYMIEAIKVGVVDVVKYPLVKQSMRTLWQHAVRKIIRQQTTPADTHAATAGGGERRRQQETWIRGPGPAAVHRAQGVQLGRFVRVGGEGFEAVEQFANHGARG